MRKLVGVSVAAVALMSASVVYAVGYKKITRSLRGYEVVPSVSTNGRGRFEGWVSADGSRVDWRLTFDALEGAVQQAHLHLGQTAVNGGITVFLCTSLGNGPAGVQPCPASPATLTGTIFAPDVSPDIAATATARTQGLDTAEIHELVRALLAGAVYVDIHSTTWPGGEIRTQIQLLPAA